MTVSVSSALGRAYARRTRGRSLTLLGLAAALAAALLLDLATGPSGMPLATVLAGLWDPAAADVGVRVILWDVRLPQALMAALVGAALGLAGAEMQTVLANPLASPFTLGISNAATLGAAIAIVAGFQVPVVGPEWTVAVTAFAFAMAATVVVQALARTQGMGGGGESLILFGIAMVFALNALLWLVQFLASADALQQIVFWTMGSLGRSTWSTVGLLAAVVALCFPWAMRHVWAMTALRAGEEHARALGIGVGRMRVLVLLRVSLLAGVALSFVGTISFIGLVGPHIARLALGEDHRLYLPGAALGGALVLSLSSVVSKSLVPGLVLPVGIVTALVGIPAFVTLILLQRRRS
ncbi:FecCD family ABC transporter permease [Caenispirillum salinarum]|uniref:FecCD family ABC transporter permease n=1 Tax=Caenispirillum salinarum TaxID=859058 RepID=UPI0038512F80